MASSSDRERAAPTLRRFSDVAGRSVRDLRSVGDKRAEALSSMGVETVFDLLTTYPRRYVDRTKQADLSDLTVGDEVAVYGDVSRATSRRSRNGKSLVEITVSDGVGTLRVVFFNQPWRAHQLSVGVSALFFGKVSDYRGTRQMTNPVVDVVVGVSGVERDPARIGRVVAIYPASGKAGLTSWEMGGFVDEALRRSGEFLDPLPLQFRRSLQLVDRTTALHDIHVPDELAATSPARRRLVFDEFWRMQMLLQLRRRLVEESAVGIAHRVAQSDLDTVMGSLVTPESSLVAQFLARHRFDLTDAQRRVSRELFTDLASTVPMHRLLQGDVGSGKTTVALLAFLAVIDGGRQGVLMAPTEVLAEQHASSLRHDVAGLMRHDESVLGGQRDLRVRLLTGKLRAKERSEVLAELASGAVDIVVGTHALLTDDVFFSSLGLVVIDEQHRFGVEQRARLRQKGREHSREARDPDLLVMTATPIPRTAAMVYFGDLDLSIVDELPQGRSPVRTTWATLDSDVDACWSLVRSEVDAGHRAFVICPLVEGSAKIEASSAVDEYERLTRGELEGLRVGLLHGQMKSLEKESVMDQFRGGSLDVLVATVVVEVGVDVPEATVMVIEDAWRFGLAQLHQLRGRVGRSSAPSYCFLLGEAPTLDAQQRLEVVVATTDGFALAEADLAIRGEGTVLGARQRGRSDLKLASLQSNREELRQARDVASEMVHASGDRSLLPEVVDELRLFIDDDEADYLFKS